MKKPEIPFDEAERLKALHSFNILDTLEEKEYDGITRIAADISNTPIALVSLVDADRQWFKSHYGIDATETPRDIAFCAHAINRPNEPLIVNDADEDERFFDNPMVIGGPKVKFYAGAPLSTKDGLAIGTLCVVDTKPRYDFSDNQKEALITLANQVMAQLELRRQYTIQKIINQELSLKNNQLKHFTYRLAHDMKTPLHGISSLVGFIKEDYSSLLESTEIPSWLDTIGDRVHFMESLIRGITNYINVTNSEIAFDDFHIEREINDVIKNLGSTTPFELFIKNGNSVIKNSASSFTQIFTNFFQNSIKFCEQPIKIWIEFYEDEDFYYFTFQDNGPGISEKFWGKVFVMFETLQRTGPKDTGIGLATVKTIIEKLGGQIRIDHRPNGEKGIFFHFSLAKEI
ncbi:MAG: histidine kinase [Pseudozobellia sp.]|nr:histidine kinase [Pseudozobellia sp.]MBG50476.1 histidine kinase [Pseudozobellia sp.]|tara:strand:- start:4863 stop:6068 length:1206 start_codon:yes stop_codon:yes gene_type:complete